MGRIKMVVTDLDGTLLNSNGKVSSKDYDTLTSLGQRGIVRVVATGRSPYSFTGVIPNDFPIDYLVFSSGGGAMEWCNGTILYTCELSAQEVQAVVRELESHRVDFMVHEAYPTNHGFLYHHNGNDNPDFMRRLKRYEQHGRPFNPKVIITSPASQVIAILPHDVDWFYSLKQKFPTLKVIRATSPLDGHSIWMEIFPTNVSKAYGIGQIGKKYGIRMDEVIAVGNDFNDLDMLKAIPNNYVVSNAPEELKGSYRVVGSNNDSGFSDAVRVGFGEIP